MTDAIETNVASAIISESFQNTPCGFFMQIIDRYASSKSLTQDLYDRGWSGVICSFGKPGLERLKLSQPNNNFIEHETDLQHAINQTTDIDYDHFGFDQINLDPSEVKSNRIDAFVFDLDKAIRNPPTRDAIADLFIIKSDNEDILLVAQKLARAHRPRLMILEHGEFFELDIESLLIHEGYTLGFFSGVLRMYYRDEDETMFSPLFNRPYEIYQQSVDAREADLKAALATSSEALEALSLENRRIRLAVSATGKLLAAADPSLAQGKMRDLMSVMGSEIAASSRELVHKSSYLNALVALPYYTDEQRPGAKNVIKSLLTGWRAAGRYWYVMRAMAARKRIVAQSGLFDGPWYLDHNSDVAGASLDPLSHFVNHGSLENRRPGPRFDGVAYLRDNPDVALAGIEPFLHYLVHGREEGRFGWRMAQSDP